jgi:hypothetical protein
MTKVALNPDTDMAYTIALQRAIEWHCEGKAVPPDVAALCPYHAERLNKTLTQPEPWTPADMAHRPGGLAQPDHPEREWREKCDTYKELMDATAKDADRAYELLRRAEVEMRYAGWNKYEADNTARNGVYEQIVRFLK